MVHNSEYGATYWDPLYQESLFIEKNQNNLHLNVLAKFPDKKS